ncbi:MAG: 30S ribosomal protein S1 [Proteobacteria bacterium]|nr:30S ribosomal protein S1 [Pseudomonadota bacterium]
MTQNTACAMDENFAQLLEESFTGRKNLEGTVVKGMIVAVRNDFAIIDVGLKSEGRILLKDIIGRDQSIEPRVGDIIDVFVERLEDKNGEACLSIEKARREASWINMENAHASETLINGVIFGRVKGGFAVDLSGVIAFLPGSQVDIRPVKDISPLLNIAQPFRILKMDKQRSNIVVSRRAVLEESRAEQRTELVAQLSDGQIITGTVKNITDYGAFIDLGGVDGLLHVTDISWKRINHPSDVLKVGEPVQVQIIRFNKETQRISLGMKQLLNDPWKDVEGKFTAGERIAGKVTSIADYGAFVEMKDGIEGLIYVTEMSWTKKNIHPSKILSVGDAVDVVVLDIDSNKRRISLGLKQTTNNPWKTFIDKYPVGSTLEGAVKNITEFGLFVGVMDDLDGMVHMSDISWDENPDKVLSKFQKGQMVSVKVLDVDAEKERISLGIKQLRDDPFAAGTANVKKGDVVTVTVTAIDEGKGIEVVSSDGASGYIKKLDLSRDRDCQRTDRFAVGEKVDAKVLMIDKNSRKLSLSIKAKELEEEKKVLSEYGSSDSGASLGDILGAAMNKAKAAEEAKVEETPKATRKKKTEEADA